MDDAIYVAVGRDVKESKSTVLWALNNFDGKFCILHVHQPSENFPSNGGNFPANRFGVRELQKQTMNGILDEYLLICRQAEVCAGKIHIEMEDVGKGIVELIHRHTIKKLVMGAAADFHYSERMTDLKSTKALYVRQHMPRFCQIWFICRGHVIHTREGDSNGVDGGSPSWQASSSNETRQSNTRIPGFGHSTRSSSEMVGDSASIPSERTWGSGSGLDLYIPTQSEEGGISNDQLFNQLDQALAEAEKLRTEAYKESISRVQAERRANEANRRASEFESLHVDESRRRKQIEEALEKEKEEIEEIRKQRDEERLVALNQKSLLESQVARFNHMMKELESKLSSALEMSEIHKKERDELRVELNNALKFNEELLQKQAEEGSSIHMQEFFSEFSISEIQEATRGYESSFKIAEGSYGSIYKGTLRHTTVAIKVLHPSSLQGSSKFQKEVEVLSKLRHPNLVTLIGACPDIWALIYEYIPNGSLEDRLSCRDNTPPLSWQTRIRIATQICSVLIFLHSSKPRSIVHGNLKPGNILLDANFVCKLCDFGISHAIPLCGSSSNITLCQRTDPNGTYLYLDPQFFATGELYPTSDIYSFGIILLQLLTGRPPLNIAKETKEMEDALAEENLGAILDTSAGVWPCLLSRQLAHLALRCCEKNRSRRPDLVSDVLTVLKRTSASCEASSSLLSAPDDHSQPPSYFICPILQEIMQEPHVAADGFTYEAEALNGWLESGHDTSPMTNLRLAHRNLIPNRSLRSSIQEWLQQH